MNIPDMNRLGLRCPDCGKGGLTASDTALTCGGCSSSFPVNEVTVDLLRTPPPQRTKAQAAMENPTIIRIYESFLWRRSPIIARVFKISFDNEYRTILKAARLPPSPLVLDLACGPGIYTRPMAQSTPDGLFVGLDLSEPMIEVARKRTSASGITNAFFVRGSAMALPFADGHFDCVNCCGAIHMFPDLHAALCEIRRVLKSGGRFTVATFLKKQGDRGNRIARWRRQHIGDTAYLPEEMIGFLAKAGLTEAEVHHAGGAWMILSARVAPDAGGNTAGEGQ